MFKKIFKKLKNIRNKDSQAEITAEEADLFDFIYFDADGQKRNFEEVLICIGLIVNKKGIPIDTRDKTRLNAAREFFNKKIFVKKDKLFVSASKKISGFLSKAQWENAVESYKNMLNHSVLLGLYVSLLKPKTDFKYDDNNLTYTKDNLVSYSVKAGLYSQAEITKDETDLFDFIYFKADEYQRAFEEVLVYIGLIANKKGIPIDTRDTPRLNAARKIFNKKTFVKKDKLFVSASKKISGFLSKAQWGNAVESYRNMLNHSVLLGHYVRLLESKTYFKYNGKLSYTKGTLASYSVQTKLCSVSVLDEDDKQWIANEYKHITKNKDDNKSRSEYWIEKPKYEQAHKAYATSEKTLLADLKSFKEHPTTDGLKKLLKNCVTYIRCYKEQYGWQFGTTRAHYALDGNEEKRLQEENKLHHLVDKEENEYKSNLRNSLDTIYQKVPNTYSNFYNQIENYYQNFDSLNDKTRLQILDELLNTCPADIDFTKHKVG